MKVRRIAVAGFQHETNTFAPGRTGFDAFEMADSWPPLLRGAAVIGETRGMNLPVAGAIAEAERRGGIEIVPILWCAAEPGGVVTDAAFDRISGEIIDGLRRAGPLDGLCLDLHGAMVTESHEDGEGALLGIVRAALGTALPVAVSLDLHANLSQALVSRADVITIYRSYPHLDMAETGARAMAALLDRLDGVVRHAAFRQAPFLVPLHAQSTDDGPCRALYRLLEDLPKAAGEYAELAMGFTAADIADCGPSVLAYGATPARASAMAEAVLARLCASESGFDTTLVPPRQAVRQAMHSRAPGPVVLADVQDNPGAGGTSDTTGLLQALIDEGAQGALLGVLCDPELARQAHGAGTGAVLTGRIGAAAGLPGTQPVAGRFRVLALSDGRIAYGGAMYGGGVASLGPSCLLAFEGPGAGIRVVVSSVRIQCLDRALFTHFGADPAAARIVCVKSTLHFRADFAPLASAVIYVDAPGAFPCRLEGLRYRRLRPGVRLGPGGRAQGSS